MASVTTVTMTDDLDGKIADETVSFALDGARYEIDLTSKNAAALRRAVQPFVANARQVSPASPIAITPRRGRRGRKALDDAATTKARLSAIRTWAADNSIHVAAKGRIPQQVSDQYDAAHR